MEYPRRSDEQDVVITFHSLKSLFFDLFHLKKCVRGNPPPQIPNDFYKIFRWR